MFSAIRKRYFNTAAMALHQLMEEQEAEQDIVIVPLEIRLLVVKLIFK